MRHNSLMGKAAVRWHLLQVPRKVGADHQWPLLCIDFAKTLHLLPVAFLFAEITFMFVRYFHLPHQVLFHRSDIGSYLIGVFHCYRR